MPSFRRFDGWQLCAYLATFLRLPLLWCVGRLVLTGQLRPAFYALLLFIVLDVLDGRIILLSEKASSQSKMFRHHFDAVIDRLASLALLIIFLVVKVLPVWIFALVTVQELVYIAAGLTAHFQKVRNTLGFMQRLASLSLGAMAVILLTDSPVPIFIWIGCYSYFRIYLIYQLFRRISLARQKKLENR